MTAPVSGQDDFDQLLSSCCDGGSGRTNGRDSTGCCAPIANCAGVICVYMGIHATLHYVIAENVPSDAAAYMDSRFASRWTTISRRSRTFACADGAAAAWRGAGLAACAVLLFVVVGGSLAWWHHRRSRRRLISAGAAIVGRISRGAGRASTRTGRQSQPTMLCGPAIIAWSRAIVQVTFTGGAEVMITAPAEFDLLSDERLVLKRGKLSARVPEPARGFTVETPSATLVDLGTEFAADVDRDGNGEVHVFRGEVIVKPRSRRDSRPLRLVEGAGDQG